MFSEHANSYVVPRLTCDTAPARWVSFAWQPYRPRKTLRTRLGCTASTTSGGELLCCCP